MASTEEPQNSRRAFMGRGTTFLQQIDNAKSKTRNVSRMFGARVFNQKNTAQEQKYVPGQDNDGDDDSMSSIMRSRPNRVMSPPDSPHKHSDLSNSYGNRRTTITSWLATPSSDICLQQTRATASKRLSYYDPEYEPSDLEGIKDDEPDDESDGEEVAQTDYNMHLSGTNKVNPTTVVPVDSAEVVTKVPKTAQAGNLAGSPKGSAIIRKDEHHSRKETAIRNKLNDKFRPVFVTKDSQGQTKKGPVQKGEKDYDMLMAELENPGILGPYGVKRRLWDFLISCIVVYLIILLPLEVFVESWETPPGLYKASKVMDYVFWVDIILNFNTGFVHYGVMYMKRKDIAMHYIQGWFFIDLVANFPFEVFFTNLESSERKSVKLLKWTKLPKLLRIGRVLKYLKQYIRYANIMGIIFTSMSILHFMTCLWIFLIYDVDTQHEFNGIDVLYFKSMHNVVVQMLGGIASESGDDDSFPYWFSLLCVMFGMLFLLLMIAHVTVVVSNTTSSYSFFRTKVDRMKKEMAYHEIPQDVQIRVMKFYDYLWLNQKHHDASSLHHDENLSGALRKEIAVYLYRDVLEVGPLFNKCPPHCLARVAMTLQTWVYLAEDKVVEKGDIGKEMFVIAMGTVRVEDDSGGHIISLAEGSFFGERSLFSTCKRSHTIVSHTLCELNVLHRDDFAEIALDYPILLKNAWTVAKKRERDDVRRKTKIKRQQTLRESGSNPHPSGRKSLELNEMSALAEEGDGALPDLEQIMSTFSRRVTHNGEGDVSTPTSQPSTPMRIHQKLPTGIASISEDNRLENLEKSQMEIVRLLKEMKSTPREISRIATSEMQLESTSPTEAAREMQLE